MTFDCALRLQSCRETDRSFLPPDVPCEPCVQDDIQEIRSACADRDGNFNITYAWYKPKVCNEYDHDTIHLPPNIVVGPCEQDYVLIGSTLPGPKYLLICAGVLGFLGMALALCISAQLKHRKLRRMYSRLVTKDDPSIEMAAPDTVVDDEHGKAR